MTNKECSGSIRPKVYLPKKDSDIVYHLFLKHYTQEKAVTMSLLVLIALEKKQK